MAPGDLVRAAPPSPATPASAPRRLNALAVPLLLCLAAFVLRLVLLPDANVWYDEGISSWTARLPLAEIAAYQAAAQHPPLHYWFLHLWGALAGDTAFPLRYSSVLFGVLAVPLLFQLGRRLGGWRLGALAALLLAVARFHIEWSQQIRMYALATTLTVLSLYLATRLLREPSLQLWLLHGLVGLLGLATLYLFALIWLSENLVALLAWLLPLGGQRRSLAWFGRWLAVQVAVALAYLPWLVWLARSARPHEGVDEITEPDFFARLYATVLPLGISTEIERYGPVALAASALVVLGLAALWRREPASPLPTTLLLACLVVPPVAVYALSMLGGLFYSPFLAARYLLLVLPAYVVALAAGVLATGRLWRPLVLGSLLFLLALQAYALADYYPSRHLRDDYQSIAAILAAQAQPGDAILLHPDEDWPDFLFYYRGDRPWYRVSIRQRITPQRAEAVLAPLLAQHDALWVVLRREASRNDPEGNVRDWLEQHAREIAAYNFGDRRLLAYTRLSERSGAQLAPDLPPPTPVPGLSGAVLGFDQPLRRFRTGDLISLGLYWDAPAARQPYEIALVDATGSPALRRVGTVPADTPTREQIIWPVSGRLASGTYRWRLKLLAGGAETTFGEVVVQQLAAAGPPPTPPIRLGVRLGDDVELIGFAVTPALDRPLRPGDRLDLTLYWRATGTPYTSYTVFAQLVGESINPRTQNLVWAQQDSVPQQGRAPTTGWAPGDVIEDPYRLEIAADTPPGHYQLQVGMYDPTSGERLLVVGTDGPDPQRRILLGHVAVQP